MPLIYEKNKRAIDQIEHLYSAFVIMNFLQVNYFVQKIKSKKWIQPSRSIVFLSVAREILFEHLLIAFDVILFTNSRQS